MSFIEKLCSGNNTKFVGFKSYSVFEFEKLKEELHNRFIQFKHKTHSKDGRKYSHNGVLVVNPRGYNG